MAFTHSIARSYTDTTGTGIGGTEVITADSERNFDGPVPTSGTANYEIDWTVTVANLKSIVLKSDLGLTIKTNSSGSPQETIVLLANVPLIWNLATDGAGKIPFSGDITKLLVTNASASVIANFKIRALTDQTPA